MYRVQRDIPMPLVTSGVEHGNIRELALARMADYGTKCRDVRTREVGIQEIHSKIKPGDIELVRRDYFANGGWETFLSYEDVQQDILIGLLRLRKVSNEGYFRPEFKCVRIGSDGRPVDVYNNGVHQDSSGIEEQKRSEMSDPSSVRESKRRSSQVPIVASIVRELHVYGSVVPVSSKDPTKFQHQGFGTLLMEEAERIARQEHGSTKMLVISGVGTRNYYRKLGYELDGPYVSKMLYK